MLAAACAGPIFNGPAARGPPKLERRRAAKTPSAVRGSRPRRPAGTVAPCTLLWGFVGLACTTRPPPPPRHPAQVLQLHRSVAVYWAAAWRPHPLFQPPGRPSIRVAVRVVVCNCTGPQPAPCTHARTRTRAHAHTRARTSTDTHEQTSTLTQINHTNACAHG